MKSEIPPHKTRCYITLEIRYSIRKTKWGFIPEREISRTWTSTVNWQIRSMRTRKSLDEFNIAAVEDTTTFYSFDRWGRPVAEYVKKNENLVPQKTKTMTYGKGELISETSYLIEGFPYSEVNYEDGSKGDITKGEAIYHPENYCSQDELLRNEEGTPLVRREWISRKIVDKEGLVSFEIEEKCYYSYPHSSDKCKIETNTYIDKLGKYGCIYYKKTDSKGNYTEEEYEYDEVGRRVSCLIKRNDTPIELIVYKYFEDEYPSFENDLPWCL